MQCIETIVKSSGESILPWELITVLQSQSSVHLRTESKNFTSVSQGKIGMTLISNLGKRVELASPKDGFVAY